MEVFGVGPFELLLVAIIGFLVLGPERIPGVMRSLGKTIRQLQQATRKMMTTQLGEQVNIPREMAELQRDLLSLRSDFNQIAQQLISAPEHLSAPPKSSATTQDSERPDAAPARYTEIADRGAPPQV